MNRQKLLYLLTGILVFLLVFVSVAGIVSPRVYILEMPAYAIQGVALDYFDLFFIVPFLCLSLLLYKLRSKYAFPLWFGGILYVLYTFVIYAFSLHFNKLFLLYCATLGISFYSFFMVLISGGEFPGYRTHDYKTGIKLIVGFLFSVSALFALLWLKEIIPALLYGNTPLSIQESGLITNAVQILDLSIVLPGMIISGYNILQRRKNGAVFAPALVVFSVIMASSLTEMLVYMRSKTGNTDISPCVVFLILIIWAIYSLSRYFKGLAD
jgi:hypothetical protein